jgi:hypothetical protein
MHAESVSGLLQGKSLAQSQNPLGSHPCPRVRMKNACLTQRALLVLGQIQRLIAQPLLHCQSGLTAKMGRLPLDEYFSECALPRSERLLRKWKYCPSKISNFVDVFENALLF